MQSLFCFMNNIKLLPSMLVFAEIAKQKSFTEAAKTLAMSKSAVSQHLSRLEEQAGSQLISRHTRGMTLTSAGEKLLARTELLKDQVDSAFQEMASAEASPAGVFSLTFPNLVAKDIVFPALKQLGVEYPGLTFRTIVTEDPLDLIKHHLDVSIFGGNLPDSSYRALPLGSTGEILCASPEYIQHFGQPKYLEALTSHRWLQARWQESKVNFYARTTTNNRLGECEALVLSPYLQCNSMVALFGAVRQGFGIALLPETGANSMVNDGKLIHVLPQYTGRNWPFFLVHAFQEAKPVHLSRFYTLARHFFTKTKLDLF